MIENYDSVDVFISVDVGRGASRATFEGDGRTHVP
jgi:hypothetical protein